MLAAIVLAAAVSGASFPAPGAYRYSASLGGQPVGEWSVSVKQDAGNTVVDENSSASLAGMSISATASLVLGPDLAPTRYEGNYRSPGQSPSVSVALTPSSAVVLASASGAPRTLALDGGTRHFVVIEPMLLAGLFALPAQLAAWKDSSVTWIAPMSAQAQAVSTAPAGSQSRPAGTPLSDAELSVAGPIPISIWYDAGTFVPDAIVVPSQGAVLTRIR